MKSIINEGTRPVHYLRVENKEDVRCRYCKKLVDCGYFCPTDNGLTCYECFEKHNKLCDYEKYADCDDKTHWNISYVEEIEQK